MELGLSQWSFHRSMLGNSRDNYEQYLRDLHSSNSEKVLRGDMSHDLFLDTVQELDIKIVDLVNILMFSKATDHEWLKAYRSKANIKGIRFDCLMCDELGHLGASSGEERDNALKKHLVWLEAASILGCQMIRVNAYGDGSYLQLLNQCSQSISMLADCAKEYGIKVVIENHGFASSNGAWLAMLIEQIGRENVGVYLDFDNFFMGGWHHQPKRFYDRTQGIIDLTPYTFGVSAKSHDFDQLGDEINIDFSSCITILRASGYDGIISAEYEGENLTEFEGASKTKELILKNIINPNSFGYQVK